MKALRITGIYLLLAVILLQGVSRIFHEHGNSVQMNNRLHDIPAYNDKCQVCDTEFTIFNNTIKTGSGQKINFTDKEFPKVPERPIHKQQLFTFSLRAPPVA